MNTHPDQLTLAQLLERKATLGDVQRMRVEGYVTEETFAEYVHAWQTGAPRFGPRQCHCVECKKRYPSPEYD